MAITEALRLVIDADTRGAVQNVQKLGATADRELSRSQKNLDKWGNGLTKAGAGLIGLGGAALFGLGKAAMASEEANLATVKLENSLRNMPKLAGESSGQFIDLAESIQDVTAADADAIVEGEALLATFNLTADEIKGITPLVVDYARKFGTDIPSAAIQVGKALDGSVGALKRNGVSIDEALFKTDRYRAVNEALSDQVGGFAQAEGKTFAGSLERLKNQMGDLAEGVGAGAVDAFSSMFGVVDSLTGKFRDLSPQTQNVIGKFATFGSVGLIAAGGLSLMIGQAIKMRQNFGEAITAISALSTKLGGLKNVALTTGPAIGAAGLALFVDQLDKAAEQANLDQLTEDFFAIGDAAKVFDENLDFQGLQDFTGVFLQVLDTSEVAAGRFIKMAEAAGVNKDVIAALKAELKEHSAASRQVGEDTAGATGGIDEMGGALDTQAEQAEAAEIALQEYVDTLNGLFDPLFGATDALMGNAEAQSAVTKAELELAAAVRDSGAGSVEAVEAQQKLTEAQIAVGKSALDVDTAMATLRAGVADGSVTLSEANAQIKAWREQGLIPAGSTADALTKQFAGTITQADKLGRQRPSPRATLDDRASTPITSLLTKIGVLGGKRPKPTVSINDSASGPMTSLLTKLGLFKSKTITLSTVLTSRTAQQAFNAGRAAGGPVSAGRAYLVGEKGPELLVPDQAGFVIPNHDLATTPGALRSGGVGGAGGSTIVINNSFAGAVISSQADAQRWVAEAWNKAASFGMVNVRGRPIT